MIQDSSIHGPTSGSSVKMMLRKYLVDYIDQSPSPREEAPFRERIYVSFRSGNPQAHRQKRREAALNAGLKLDGD